MLLPQGLDGCCAQAELVEDAGPVLEALDEHTVGTAPVQHAGYKDRVAGLMNERALGKDFAKNPDKAGLCRHADLVAVFPVDRWPVTNNSVERRRPRVTLTVKLR